MGQLTLSLICIHTLASNILFSNLGSTDDYTQVLAHSNSFPLHSPITLAIHLHACVKAG